jgi:chemotaxis protein methyltransferase CheR
MQSYSSLVGLPDASSDDVAASTRLLKARAGLVLGPHKRDMVARILGSRTRSFGVRTVAEYLAYLQQNAASDEWNHFVNAFTINHTAFFREHHHFDILAKFLQTRRAPVSIWSCAASTGEEPYSLAITLREARPGVDLRQSIWATDIDTRAIENARKGVYTTERVKSVPEPLLKKYFQRGRKTHAGKVRVKPELASLVHFDVLNLCAPTWAVDSKFDAIFCRNIMIYFDKATQIKILDRFVPLLKPGGLLFAGHSENFTYLTDKFRLRGQTVYVRGNER